MKKGTVRALMWSVLTGKGSTTLHHRMYEGGLPGGLAVTVRREPSGVLVKIFEGIPTCKNPILHWEFVSKLSLF